MANNEQIRQERKQIKKPLPTAKTAEPKLSSSQMANVPYGQPLAQPTNEETGQPGTAASTEDNDTGKSGGNPTNAIKQAQDISKRVTGDTAKKAVGDQVAKQAATKAGMATGPAGWAVAAWANKDLIIKIASITITVLAGIALLVVMGILTTAQSGCGGKTTSKPTNLLNQNDMTNLKLLRALTDVANGGKKYILEQSAQLLDTLQKAKDSNAITADAQPFIDKIIAELNIIIAAGGKTDAAKKTPEQIDKAEDAADQILAISKELAAKLNDPAFGKIGNYGEIKNTYGYAKPTESGQPTSDENKDDGLDIAVPVGTNVMAINDGTIAFVDMTGSQIAPPWNTANGGGVKKPNSLGSIRIDFKDGRHAFYAHLSQIDLTLDKGVQVKKGQIIAKSGQAKDQEHLHIGIYDSENATSWAPSLVSALWFK